MRKLVAAWPPQAERDRPVGRCPRYDPVFLSCSEPRYGYRLKGCLEAIRNRSTPSQVLSENATLRYLWTIGNLTMSR